MVVKEDGRIYLEIGDIEVIDGVKVNCLRGENLINCKNCYFIDDRGLYCNGSKMICSFRERDLPVYFKKMQ